jgi:hypothetical protein
LNVAKPGTWDLKARKGEDLEYGKQTRPSWERSEEEFAEFGGDESPLRNETVALSALLLDNRLERIEELLRAFIESRMPHSLERHDK